MRFIKCLLPSLLLSSTLLSGPAEDTKRANTKDPPSKHTTKSTLGKDYESKSKPSGKPSVAGHKAASQLGGPALDARLKALENENLKLRQELAEKLGAALLVPGAESSTPEGALAELKAGNTRFVVGARTRSQMAINDPTLRQTLAKGQSPFAVIVTCSDSRLGDNFIFDQELGRLFTIREAGNCPDTQGLASIEYAIEHLGSKLVVVMGHDSCGAVKAVMESGATLMPGNLWSIQAAMVGLLDSVHHEAGETPSDRLGRLVRANAERQARIVLDRSPVIQHLCVSGKVKVVPAVYDLASGRVAFLPPVGMTPAKAEHH
jgi:carbonic anhydrase